MAFDYSVYYRQNCMVPLGLLAFTCFWLFLLIRSWIKGPSAKEERTGVLQTSAKLLGLVIGLQLAAINVLPLARGGVFLLTEKETDAVHLSGVIEETMDLASVEGFKYDVPENKGYGQTVTVNGRTWYLMTYGALQPGDPVEMDVLPKSGLVLRIERGEDG